MSYNKLGFTSGQTLKAEHLNHMEDGIANAGGGAFILRPTENELSGDFSEIICTTNYDEMAKALESGTPVYIILPESFGSSGTSTKEVISLLTWVHASQDGMSLIGARFVNFSEITSSSLGRIMFTNGTYVPKI